MACGDLTGSLSPACCFVLQLGSQISPPCSGFLLLASWLALGSDSRDGSLECALTQPHTDSSKPENRTQARVDRSEVSTVSLTAATPPSKPRAPSSHKGRGRSLCTSDSFSQEAAVQGLLLTFAINVELQPLEGGSPGVRTVCDGPHGVSGVICEQVVATSR